MVAGVLSILSLDGTIPSSSNVTLHTLLLVLEVNEGDLLDAIGAAGSVSDVSVLFSPSPYSAYLSPGTLSLSANLASRSRPSIRKRKADSLGH